MRNSLNLKLWWLLACLFAITVSKAQERTTKETKVVVIVHEAHQQVAKLQLLNTFLKTDEEAIFKKYPKHSFFYGMLKGTYELRANEVSPLVGATITVYTERQLFAERNFYANKELIAGDTYKLGETKTAVVDSKKGELVLVAQ